MPTYYDSLDLKIINKPLAEIFSQFKNNIEESGYSSWEILYDDNEEPLGINYSNDETAPYPEFYDPSSFTQFLYSELLEKDGIEGAEELPGLIKENQEHISNSYQYLSSSYDSYISEGSLGPAEDAVNDAVKKWGFDAIDQSSPEFEKEVRKWELIAKFEMYTGLNPFDVKFNIEKALAEGNSDLLLEGVYDRNETNIKYTPETGWVTTGNPEPDRSGKDYEEYQRLVAAVEYVQESSQSNFPEISQNAKKVKVSARDITAEICIPEGMTIYSDELKASCIQPFSGYYEPGTLLEIIPNGITFEYAEFAVVLYQSADIDKGDFIFDYGSEQQINAFWKDEFLKQANKHNLEISKCQILDEKFRKMLLLGSYDEMNFDYPFGIVLYNQIYVGYILSDKVKNKIVSEWLEQFIELD